MLSSVNSHVDVPKHVAIVMDGNGRWAKQRNLPRVAGHRAGAEALRKAIKYAAENKVGVLSLFAFSTENWNRPAEEVNSLMRLFLNALKNESKNLHQQNIKLRIIGNTSAFSEKIQQQINKVEALTSKNTGMILVIAANYGGRWDITQAVQQIARDVTQGKLSVDQVNESMFGQYLSLADLPEPDLFIRTSGELRISNFFLWQLAYTEFYFSEVLWPDFDEKNFAEALESFAQRQRRFGLTEKKRG